MIARIKGLPYLFIIGAGLIWGITFSLTLVATADGTHPMVLTTLQVIICSGLFSLIGFVFKVPVFRLANLKHYGLLAVIGITLPDFLYYAAAFHLSAGILSITVSTVPMLTYVLAWVFGFELFAWLRASGIIFGMLAIVFLVFPEHGLQSSDASFWTLMVLVCAVCYAVENIYISERVDQAIDVRELLSGSNMIAVLFLVPVMFIQGHTVPLEWFISDSAWAVLGVSVSSTLAYVMYFHTIKIAGPVFASQCSYIVTLSGVLWGIVLLSESHSFWVWVSVAIMMIGLALVTPTAKPDTD